MKNLLTFTALCLLISGCASRQHTVILLPDPDGRTGRAEVATVSGRQQLEKPSDMTRVSGGGTPPSAVTTASPELISSLFSEVLSVEPHPSEKFILFFETGTTNLATESKAMISRVVAESRRRGSISISISGHTDATGSAAYNEKLALQRAEIVREVLLKQGISAELLSVSSHGKGNPLVATPDGVAEPRNRRVEVVVR